MFSSILQITLLNSYLLSYSVCSADDLIIQLPEGQIRGHVLKSFNGSDYYAFQEIPYAAPPVGENRFKEPKYPDPWSGILNTTGNTKICLQNQSAGSLQLTEDCLYLNVYTPQQPGNDADLLPVMVWIHGGGFITGSGAISSAGPGIFMDYNVIVVTINYRLGPFGFLNTMDGVIPGNLGLKDQRHALRWVNKNIQLFGGDPNKVTIAGESAGAFSVAYLLGGENLDGLFRGAIQESGTSIARVGYTDKSKQFAFTLGHIIDKTINEQNSSTDLLKTLQTASASDILAAGVQVTDDEDKSLGFLGDIIWAPVMESNKDSEDPLLTKPMYESFINGNFYQVPLLTGHNSEEILMFVQGRDPRQHALRHLPEEIYRVLRYKYRQLLLENTVTKLRVTGYVARPFVQGYHVLATVSFNQGRELILAIDEPCCYFGEAYDADPSLLVNRKLNIPSEDSEIVGRRLSEIYTNNSFSKNLAGCIKYCSDVTYQNPIVRQAECTSKYAPVYLYRFAYAGLLGQFVYPNGRPVIPGVESVGHAEELMYLWQFYFADTVPDSDLPTLRRIHTLWTNFIKYLNPTPEKDEVLENIIWPQLNASNIQFLNINDTLEVLSNPRHYQEVNELFQKYQQPPFLVW